MPGLRTRLVNQARAITVGVAAIVLAVLSFVVLGFGQFLLGYRTAVLIAAPIGTLAFLLGIGLAVLFLLGRVGVGPLTAPPETE